MAPSLPNLRGPETIPHQHKGVQRANGVQTSAPFVLVQLRRNTTEHDSGQRRTHK